MQDQDLMVSIEERFVVSLERIKDEPVPLLIGYFINLAGNVQSAFLSLGKLLSIIQAKSPGSNVFPMMTEAGITSGTISNALYAARVFDLVVQGHLTEEEYDRLKFRDCLAISRMLRDEPAARVMLMYRDKQHVSNGSVATVAIEVEGSSEGPGGRMDLTERGLSLNTPLTPHLLTESLRRLASTRTMFHYGLGDLMKAGRDQLGQAAVDEAMTEVGINHADALRAGAVEAIPQEKRRQDVTSDHYLVVEQAGLTDRAAEAWIAKAAAHHLSPLNLRRSIQAGRIISSNDVAVQSGRNSGVDTIENVLFWFERWHNKIRKADPISEWTSENKRRLMRILQPIIDLYQSVEASL